MFVAFSCHPCLPPFLLRPLLKILVSGLLLIPLAGYGAPCLEERGCLEK